MGTLNTVVADEQLESQFLRTEAGLDVLFPWHVPFRPLRGYVVPSPRMRCVVFRSLKFYRTICAPVLAGAFCLDLVLGSGGLFATALVIVDVLYAIRIRRLTRRMSALPVLLSLRVYSCLERGDRLRQQAHDTIFLLVLCGLVLLLTGNDLALIVGAFFGVIWIALLLWICSLRVVHR